MTFYRHAVARLGEALQRERNEKATQRLRKRRKLEDILTTQQEEMDDRETIADRAPTSFSVFFNRLENESPPAPQDSMSSSSAATASSSNGTTLNGHSDPSPARGTKRKAGDAPDNSDLGAIPAPPWGTDGNGLVGKLARFLDQHSPSSPPLHTFPSSPSTSPVVLPA